MNIISSILIILVIAGCSTTGSIDYTVISGGIIPGDKTKGSRWILSNPSGIDLFSKERPVSVHIGVK